MLHFTARQTASCVSPTLRQVFPWLAASIAWLAIVANHATAADPPKGGKPLAGTAPLTIEGDLSAYLLDGAHKFVDREIERSVERRERHWKRDFSSNDKYAMSVSANRARLAGLLGVVDPPVKSEALHGKMFWSLSQASKETGPAFEVLTVKWPVFEQVTVEGMYLRPKKQESKEVAICLFDLDVAGGQLEILEEQAKLLNRPVETSQQMFHWWGVATRLASEGCHVFVPVLINRQSVDAEMLGNSQTTNISNREYIYRQAFEAGKHVLGYEVQAIRALVDAIHEKWNNNCRVGLLGVGEGGLVSLYAAAIDERIAVTAISSGLRSRQFIYKEPIYHNAWGLLDEFGDAEVASLICPRALLVDMGARLRHSMAIDPTIPGERKIAAPGDLSLPREAEVKLEVERTERLMGKFQLGSDRPLKRSSDDESLIADFFGILTQGRRLPDLTLKEEVLMASIGYSEFLHSQIWQRSLRQWTDYTQSLIRESEYVRKDFFKNADRKSRDPAKWDESAEWYRKYFYDEVIGRFEHDLKPFNPRTRQVYDTDKYRGYEVVLDVFDEVIAYGVLLVPKDIKPGEQRPVVVCQHGLEGRPQDTIQGDLPGERYYHQFAAKLCERGFVTFAPQNLYIFKDRFRELQRKLNPLKKTLFSIIVPQHEQICRWLKSQPFVDGERIGFYGLSYGGKSAMRIPPLVDHYKAVICSGDFNEWIRKCTSVRDPFSYVGTGEYEIWEWNLANTFNYAEMAALICPRPFMVERGHRDGVGIDEWVDYEYAKVRLLYVDLKIPERTEIEHFDGPHEINGVGAYKFLHKHLNWPEPK